MLLDVQPQAVPLVEDADGVLRVEGSRVTLDSIVSSFAAGAAAEEIAYQYPSVELADIYAVLTYYLRHRAAVTRYLQERRVRAAAVREANEAAFDPTGVRERLLARRGG